MIFGENCQKGSFWGPKCRHISKFDESAPIIFPYRRLKIISVRFMDRNVVKNVINGVNLVKIGNFL